MADQQETPYLAREREKMGKTDKVAYEFLKGQNRNLKAELDRLRIENEKLKTENGRLLLLESRVEMEICPRCNYQRSIACVCKCGQLARRGTNDRLRDRIAELEAELAERKEE